VLPPLLQREYDKLRNLIGVMSFKHAQLEHAKDDAERFEIAKEIIANAEQRRAIFNRLDHYRTTGNDLIQATPVVVAKSETSELLTLQLRAELVRLRVQRTKLKSNTKRVAD